MLTIHDIGTADRHRPRRFGIVMERLTYTVSEVAQLLGISRSKAYDLVAAGLLPVVPLPGRRKLVARAVLERLVEAPEAHAERLTDTTNGLQHANGRHPVTTTRAPASRRVS
jgi:excisionase family DNA binding protein